MSLGLRIGRKLFLETLWQNNVAESASKIYRTIKSHGFYAQFFENKNAIFRGSRQVSENNFCFSRWILIDSCIAILSDALTHPK